VAILGTSDYPESVAIIACAITWWSRNGDQGDDAAASRRR
jgi:hypothetical protein